MRYQLLILGVSFIIFGIIAWIAQAFSVAYIGLMGFGLIAVAIFILSRPRTRSRA